MPHAGKLATNWRRKKCHKIPHHIKYTAKSKSAVWCVNRHQLQSFNPLNVVHGLNCLIKEPQEDVLIVLHVDTLISFVYKITELTRGNTFYFPHSQIFGIIMQISLLQVLRGFMCATADFAGFDWLIAPVWVEILCHCQWR